MAGPAARTLGRYALYDEIASGGMGTVHLGRLLGQAGFARTVAIKRLLPAFAKDPDFVSALLAEARLAARIRHPNVVPTVDVVDEGGEVALVMEWVLGDSVANLLKKLVVLGEMAPVPVAARIAVDALQGLHAAHEATSEDGLPLGLVHRDVSPQNLLVGADGTTRVLDFGIAKASLSSDEHTQLGMLKGKLGYLAPEQLRGERIDRRVDIYAASVVLWELLARERLFGAGDDRQSAILRGDVRRPSKVRPDVPIALEAVVMRGLSLSPDERWSSAREMALAIEAALLPASALEVSEWVEGVAADTIRARREAVRRVESSVAPPASFDDKTEPFSLGAPRDPDPTVPQPAPAPAPQGMSTRLAAALGLAGVLAVVASFGLRDKMPAAPASSSSATPSVSAPPSVSPSPSVSASAPVVASCADRPLSDVVELAAGPASHHTCARQKSGAVWCWGDNAAGQLGVGDKDAHMGARRVKKLSSTFQVALGTDHTCVVDEERGVRCWGRGRLLNPTQVIGLTAVGQIAAGGRHDCALHTNGSIECWGDDDLGQLGSTSHAAAFAVRVEGVPPASFVAAGGTHTCARTNAGDVFCWGGNDLGQLGNGATDKSPHPHAAKVTLTMPVASLASGDKTAFVLSPTGELSGWGFSVKRPLAVPIHEVVQVSAGGRVTCARKRDDTVHCWGFDDAGQLGGEPAEDSVTPKKLELPFAPRSLAAGESHVCALDEAKNVWCWGTNEKGELGAAPDAARHPKPVRVLFGECP